ncbi:AAA family ATPase [Anabaena sphaerica FACHB-251]|uniref:AAA family ATPase n=1 Tax=Anabaena sphaerica FACHB-251 TaxID=2692883 RepID=A0A926WM56_9NOST|nr:AAA family ATPase [Anabaena sphaerica]MBD2295946.1 AAA family ATPase [Anabaena sphaerica FACHB-251]
MKPENTNLFFSRLQSLWENARTALSQGVDEDNNNASASGISKFVQDTVELQVSIKPMIKQIKLPESKNTQQNTNILETEQVIVVVGANGSGKTRLGTWLEFESEDVDKIHRISAQKSLSIPRNISPKSLESAEYNLRLGIRNQDIDYRKLTFRFDNIKNQELSHITKKEFLRDLKKQERWDSKPATFLLNDFPELLNYLFSDNYEAILKFKETLNKHFERIEPPVTKLDKVKNIWEYLLPHRELIIKSSCIEAKIKEDYSSYHASEMSDGERVIFYLIGQCLTAPENGIIIIDEPEIHLHKSIQRKLWDSVEKERKDCIFIYLTHDLEFASTRFGSKKICLNSFDGNQFDWYEVPETEDFPESVYLEVIGSRSPVLFIEGENSSHDLQLYKYIYPDFTIKPLSSCEKVIEAVKTFNSLNSLHNVQSFGIIDRDYKSEEHIKAYAKHRVYAPEFAEVENIFLIEEVLFAVAEQLCITSPEDVVSKVKNWVMNEFNRLKETYALEATSYRINLILNSFNGKSQSFEKLEKSVENLKNTVDVRKIYEENIQYAEAVISEQNYNEVLKIFNHKGLLGQVGKFFDIKPSAYAQKVKDIIQCGNLEIVQCMRKKMPELK